MTKCSPHYHYIVTPSGLVRTNNDCYTTDEELGFIGLLTAIGSAIGGAVSAGKAIKKATSKKKKSSTSTATVSGETEMDDSDDIIQIVQTLLSELPREIRDQLTFALSEFRTALTADKNEMDNLVKSVSQEFKPHMDLVMKLLEEKQLQTQATNEHNIIVKNDKRWQANTENQQKILERLDLLERRLGSDIRANEIYNRRVAAAFGMPAKFSG